MRRYLWPYVLALLLPLVAGAAEPDTMFKASARLPIQVYAAGSLRGAINALIEAYGLPVGSFAPPVYGASGLLRERLEGGEQADLFASADMAQPCRLVAAGHGTAVVMFARNRMCALARTRLGITPANLLDRLLDPSVKLATSTPVPTPAGITPGRCSTVPRRYAPARGRPCRPRRSSGWADLPARRWWRATAPSRACSCPDGPTAC